MNGIKCLLRLFIGIMIAFVVQKMFFLCMTWHDGTMFGDFTDVLLHGLKLDSAVAGYVLALPWLLLFVQAFADNKFMTSALKVYFFIVSLLTAIIIVVDASLYPFWQFKLDASVFLYTDKPKDALASVSLWFVLTRLLYIVIWTLLLYFIFSRLCTTPKNEKHNNFIPVSAMYLLAGALIFLVIRGGVGKGTNNVSEAYYSDNQYLNHAAVNPVFNFIYSLGKQEDFGSKYQFFEEAERASLMSGIYITESTDVDTLLNTDRPDIVLIVWEGCSEAMTYCLGGKSNITPRLTALAEEGILFSQCYSNSYRTDRGLVCIMAGWLGLPDASLMKMPQKSEKLPSIARTLHDNGYTTRFWYGGDISFTNMGGYMRQAGFTHLVSELDFPLKQRTTDWGVVDGVLLERVAKEIPHSAKPSFDVVMTLSSHEPWDVPFHELSDERENAFRYTDQCISNLINTLRKSPRWENTLVIITADHGAADASKTRYDQSIIHLPMIWCGGAVKHPMVIDKLMNQSDLAATLLGQLHMKHDNFIFSRDVMSSNYVYPTATFCYNNGVLFADSTGVTVYDNDAARTIVGKDSVREGKAKATLQTLYTIIGKE